MKRQLKIGDHVTVDGEVWEVMTLGKRDHQRGTQYTHLASTTRFREQANGRVPAQIARWL